jgi:insertion element IS1 protein InsB
MFNCKFCGKECIKKGWQCLRQKLFCKSCKKYQQLTYSSHKINSDHQEEIFFWNKEGSSISSISRRIKFSKTTVCKTIKRMAKALVFSFPVEANCEYEVDELKTFVGNKKNEAWVMYALNKVTKRIITFVIGRRTKENLQKITDVLLGLNPKRIFTDKLLIYPLLLPKNLHRFKKRMTNHIERKNLHLRQQIRRLQRKTICFSKSENMLCSVVALFFAAQK